jgi:hypothetical protein
MEEWKIHSPLQFENLKGRDHLGDLDSDRRIILKFILKK